MSELKRYDQALSDQLEHLPMPPEDFAWAEMKKLLDEDDDDPVVIPFFKRLGCWLPALLAVLLLSIGGWYYYNSRQGKVPDSSAIAETKKQTNSDHSVETIPADSARNPYDSISRSQAITAGSSDSSANDDGTTGKPVISSTSPQAKSAITAATPVPGNHPGGNSIAGSGNKPGQKNNTNNKANGRRIQAVSNAKTRLSVSPGLANGDEDNTGDSPGPGNGKPVMLSDKGKQTLQVKNPSMDSLNDIAKQMTDTTGTKKYDSLKKPVTISETKKEKPGDKEPEQEKKKKEWMLAAGLSIYQPVNIAGQSSVPFNYYGRKNGISDYIPSVYFRLYRVKKWFLHTEFRYAAPQAVEAVNYKSIVDTVNQLVETSVYNVKKTYYHQVPLSFNYYVLPNLSVGAGVIYNRFTGAIANLDKYRGIPGTTNDTLISSGIIRETNDDRFVKNKWQWSAELQYNWKRLMLGARYSRDLQPYLKYTDDLTGEYFEKYAQSLNIYLRYELWRSKKK